MSWGDVGSWLVNNAGKGAALVGSLLTGNVPGAVAAGISMVSSATGHNDADQALTELKGNPDAIVKLKQIAADNEESIRKHIEAMEQMRLQDEQSNQTQQQETIRSGDNSTDEYVRRTRPQIVREAWWAFLVYCFAILIDRLVAADMGFTGVPYDAVMAGTMLSPVLAYFGFRTADKRSAGKLGRLIGSLKTPS